MSDVDFRKLAKELAGKQKSSSSTLLLVVVTLIAVALVWAAVTDIDNVVRGAEKPYQKHKTSWYKHQNLVLLERDT